MSNIFGPVPSRRLGLSLGVDLIPPKTCTYNCLYCEVGKTTRQTLDAAPFVTHYEIADELETALIEIRPDTITLGGSGEPTLNNKIDHIISSIKKMTDIRVALLTNGSLFWKEEILKKVLAADIILPTFSTVFNDTYETIHRPCHGLNVSLLISGLKALRKYYQGLIFLEVVLLSGINDTENEIEGLKRAMDEISPDKVQLNTVIRPPSDPRAMPVDMTRMEEIKGYIGSKAEIVGYMPSDNKSGGHESRRVSVIEMAKRRPIRVIDIADSLNITLEETERLIKGLLIKGQISEKRHGEEIFYIARQQFPVRILHKN